MEKILTVVVPTYNMQECLHRCLDSLIVSDNLMQSLEVLVINDGSKDKSSEIAHEYQDKYPNTFRVIDKENGNYGSCVNRGLQESKGKYFRLLDADDWFDTNEFGKFISLLKCHNEDIILTNYTYHYIFYGKQTLGIKNLVEWGKKYNLNRELIPEECLAMHCVTIRSDLLYKIGYRQTEGISYTDTEYVYYPIIQARDMYAANIDLYQYFIGRSGQTMSIESLVKNYQNFVTLFNNLQEYVPLYPNKNFENIRSVYLYRMLSYLLDINILFDDYNSYRDKQLRNLFKSVSNDRKLFSMVMSNKKFGISYVSNWYYGSFRNLMQSAFFWGYRKMKKTLRK